MSDSMIDQVCRIVREALAHRYWLRPAPEVEAGTPLDDLGADSLDRVTIAMACDEAFGIEICTRDVARWTCPADVLASVKGSVAA